METLEQRENTRNLLLKIAYDGTDFYGWQIQPQRPTIQGLIADALRKVCGEEVEVCGSGRTDAGVHACGQAANVRLSCTIPCSNLIKALNRLLPESIRILSAEPVPQAFHARRDASSKIYGYRIFRGNICPPSLARYVFPYPYGLDEGAMDEAARYFEGTQDFRSFAAADRESHPQGGGQEKSYVRTVFRSVVARQADELTYTVEGNGFLRYMVRNIVGTLIDVGRGRTAARAIPEMIAAHRRSAAGPTAPARGLHLVSVSYAAEVTKPLPLDNHPYPAKIE